jgi:hypothetical protein
MHIRYFLLVCVCLSAAYAAAAPAPAGNEATAREIVTSLAAGHAADAESHFDATMKAALPPAKLDEVWRSIVAQYGAYQKVTEVQMSEEAGYHVVLLWTKFEQGMITTKVVFNDKGEVAGLFFLPVRTGD